MPTYSKSHAWTAEEEKRLIQLGHLGYSTKEIAEVMGRLTKCVQRKLSIILRATKEKEEIGKDGCRWTDQLEERLKKLQNRGYGQEVISRTLSAAMPDYLNQRSIYLKEKTPQLEIQEPQKSYIYIAEVEPQQEAQQIPRQWSQEMDDRLYELRKVNKLGWEDISELMKIPIRELENRVDELAELRCPPQETVNVIQLPQNTASFAEECPVQNNSNRKISDQLLRQIFKKVKKLVKHARSVVIVESSPQNNYFIVHAEVGKKKLELALQFMGYGFMAQRGKTKVLK